MATHTENKYTCDNCDKKLLTFSNYVEIVTPKRGYEVDGGQFWQRIVVKIENHHGIHNAGEEDRADLCQRCTVKILEDALKRATSPFLCAGGCGYPVAQQGDLCGECACEDDGL